jgi:hypothetical protein
MGRHKLDSFKAIQLLLVEMQFDSRHQLVAGAVLLELPTMREVPFGVFDWMVRGRGAPGSRLVIFCRRCRCHCRSCP